MKGKKNNDVIEIAMSIILLIVLVSMSIIDSKSRKKYRSIITKMRRAKSCE